MKKNWDVKTYSYKDSQVLEITAKFFNVLSEEEGEDVDLLRMDILKSLVAGSDHIFFYGIPDGAVFSSWYKQRPNTVSILQWTFSSRRQKFSKFLEAQTKKDQIQVVQPIDSEWRVGLYFGNNQSLIDTYCARFGFAPDEIPDLVFTQKTSELSADAVSSLEKVAQIVVHMGHQEVTESNQEILAKALLTSPLIACMQDGYMWIISKDLDSILMKLKKVAEKHGLDIRNVTD